MKAIAVEIKKASFSVLPIYFLIAVLSLLGKISLGTNEFLTFSFSTLAVIIGIALFSYGADSAMTPIGKIVGKGLIKQGKISRLLVVAFLFGFFITVAEPDLSVLARQTSSVFPKALLVALISLSVGTFLIFAVLKIIYKTNITNILSTLYMLVFAISAILISKGRADFLPLCFDSGGVTTGPITVPFLMALGIGASGILAKRSEKDASFGFVAFSSVGPIMVMLLLSLFFSGNEFAPAAGETFAGSFFPHFLRCVLVRIKEVGLSVGLLFACYFITDALFIHSERRKVLFLFKGMLVAFAGLVVFLSAVDASYMTIGFKIGTQFATMTHVEVFAISFTIGALTIIAEPAVKILTSEVEEVTNGIIKRRNLLVALAFGAGVAISLSLLRIIYGFPFLYIVAAGYGLCFVLSFFVPKIYTAVAFDAGGVASGPLTSSFILPVSLGFASTAGSGGSVLAQGFGIVALVALSPLVFIELLGVVSLVSNRKKVRSGIKSVMTEKDSRVSVSFSEPGRKKIIDLYLLVVTVPKGKNEVISDILEKYYVTLMLNTYARGSADRGLTKDLMLCIIRGDKIKDAILEIEDKFTDFNSNISMVYAVPFDSVMGASNYLMLSNGERV